MYDQYRNEILVSLDFLSEELQQKVINKIDKISMSYEIKKKETSLTPYICKIPDELKAYLISKKIEGCSVETIKNYGTILSAFFLGVQKRIQEITALDLRMWLYNYQQERQVADSTIEYYRGIINSFFIWCLQEGYIEKNPVVSVRPIKCEKKQRHALTRIELEYFRNACTDNREIAIVETFFSTGCRVSELASLKKEDVNWENKTVHVLGKGNKHRTCYLNARCVVALDKYLSMREDKSEFLFVSQRYPFDKLSKSGIEKIINKIYLRVKDKISIKITPHILRHTTATLALQNGMKISNISTMLGHSKIETTMIYAEVDPQEVHNEHDRYVI